jgi:HEAT repeat protein
MKNQTTNLKLKGILMKKSVVILASLILTTSLFAAEADYSKIINELIPTLASTNVPDRYGAQMELQKIALETGRPGAEAERSAMAKALASSAADTSVPQPARVWLVRQIEYIGGDETVDALQKILNENDSELRECARRALEKNPSPRSVLVLREQLRKEKDLRMKIGLIHSLGEHRDKEAAPIIAQYLKNSEMGSAPALALGKIATPEAITALQKCLNDNPFAGEALIEAGNRNLLSGNKQLAKQVFQQLYENCSLVSVKGAALVGLGKSDPDGSYNTIRDAALKGDQKLQVLAVNAIKESYKDYSTRLMEIFPTTVQIAKLAILNAIDNSAEQQLINILKGETPQIRQAALRTLGKIGSALSVPVLIKYIAEGTPEEKTAAENSLNSIPGKNVEKEIENFATNGQLKERVAAINAIGARRQIGSVGVVAKALSDSNQDVRKSAFAAIAKIGTDSEFEQLVSIAIKEKSKEAISALEQIASRVKDKEACGKKLASAVGNDEKTIVLLLGVFSAIGTDDCLKPVEKLLASKDNSLKLSAVQTLSEWQSLNAAKLLLPILTDASVPRNIYSAALRGITGNVSQSEGAPSSKAEIILQAYNSVQSESDKKVIISAMANIPEQRIAQKLMQLLDDPKFRLEAGQAAIVVAEGLAKTDKKTAIELASAIKKANISPEITKRAEKIK